MACLYINGNRCSYTNRQTIPKNTPLIIVANHQSMFDIIAISWFMRKLHPKFVSKIELGKGLPSISFNLKYGGNVLIDRSNPRQSLPALSRFSKYIKENNRAAVIFPEGTRSKTGKPKSFSPNGLRVMFKQIPNAVVVPVTINNSWKLLRYGSFPINAGINLNLKVQEPIAVNSIEQETLIAEIEKRIISDIH